MFVDLTLSLLVGFLSAVATLIVFSIVLWQLSGVLRHWGITIPGDLLWVAVVYAVFGTLLTHVIGKPLIRLDFNQQRFEADFRFSLVRLRENSEGVALYGGEKQEESSLRGRFVPVIRNWWALMYKQKQLTWFTSFYAQLAIIFPFVVAAPGFFAGTITLGVIFQTASAFGQVQGALSWFISAYPTFAQWKATVDRLIGFAESLDRVREEADRLDGDRIATPGETIALEGLEITLPQGAPLLAATSIEFKPGEHVLVTGPSGAGKSTFFRSLAGIWPYWKGRIRLPGGARLLFLPQKPYLPLGSLKHAVSYPEQADKLDDSQVREALEAVGLAHLAADLERTENWAQVLSGGEQQRLAFARALLVKPDWLFLDEATAALPEGDQDALYRRVKQQLPRTTLVSVGHRESLAAHHDRRLAWQGRQLALA
jgi:putative ATP-binding cassette transporter